MVFVAVGLLAGCTPEPLDADPTPTFTSESEAFAAAEATYRAYVDALNDVDLSDPETFEAVYSWTTGEANAGARRSFSKMHADGWMVDGPTEIALVEPTATQPSTGDVTLDVCLDVSGVSLVDQNGASVVDKDRRDIQSMRIHLTAADSSPTALAIALIEGREGDPTCGGQ